MSIIVITITVKEKFNHTYLVMTSAVDQQRQLLASVFTYA